MILQLGIVAPYQVVKGLSYPGIVLDKSSKVTCGTNELPYTGHGLWIAHLGNLLDTFLTRQHPCGRNFMSKIRQALFEEVAFRWFEFQPV